MDNDMRKMWFGKYKDTPIKQVILEHIGYIMWCLNNLPWFKLTDDEQWIYDHLAIAIKKFPAISWEFPTEHLYVHIKNKEDFLNLNTPFMFDGNMVQCLNKSAYHQLDDVESVGYVDTFYTSMCNLMRCINKEKGDIYGESFNYSNLDL